MLPIQTKAKCGLIEEIQMITCTVTENSMGHLTVDFGDGKSLYLQSDYDRVSFGVDCGLIPAPMNWDGCPSTLMVDWCDFELEEITECPEEYYDAAD
jgi:hypothetical protein